jgi:hypothetical protein
VDSAPLRLTDAFTDVDVLWCSGLLFWGPLLRVLRSFRTLEGIHFDVNADTRVDAMHDIRG